MRGAGVFPCSVRSHDMGLLDEIAHDTAEGSDEEILARSIRTPSLFGVLVSRYEDAFLRKALSIVRGREEAEDIVQETFAKIYLNAPRFKEVPGASFKSWGYRILINTALTHYQKRKRERGETAELPAEFYEVLPDTAMRQFEHLETREYLISVLSKMPEHLSRILSLHFLDGKPQKEIATDEGMSVGAVKTRIHRAKKEFKKIADTLVV